MIEIEEYPDVHHHGQGITRKKKTKASSESQARKNRIRRIHKVKRMMIQYFNKNDLFVTLTYNPENRPEDMDEAKKHFKVFIRQIRRFFNRKKVELRWMRNIERGTKGKWHIHLLIKNLNGLLDKIESIWPYGGLNAKRVGKDVKYIADDFQKLAEYITKDETPFEKRKDGSYQKPRVKEASFSASRNMPVPEPKVEKLKRWKKEPYCKKGYQILKGSIYEGTDIMGFLFRKYMMLRI